MCGIVGMAAVDPDRVSEDAVRSAADTLVHRGPDAGGVVSLPGVCLGHRRLSILDVKGSAQPWESTCGRYFLTFNGEIYNYLELKHELAALGHEFRSNGDTEVLLTTFIEYGDAALNKLNGMFAFAIWDQNARRLFIARDRLGKKPLYYAMLDGRLIFASELRALREFGLSLSIDPIAVEDYFAHQFVGGERSIYREIRKLQPGHYLVFAHGRTEIKQYWCPPIADPQPGYSETAVCGPLQELLDDAVRLRLRSDVPLGAFLSGGLDSSIVVETMRRLGSDVATYTIGFQDTSYDETAYANAVARHLSVQSRTLQADLDPVAIVHACVDWLDEPFADPSIVPTWMLCEFTRKYVTVALSGDGVDELFGGYRRYRAASLARYAKIVPAAVRDRLLRALQRTIGESDAYYGSDRMKQLRLFCDFLRKQEEAPGDPLAQTFTQSERSTLLDYGRCGESQFDFIAEYELRDLDVVTQMMQADLRTYLAENILTKVDRASMRHSLEVRSPFLDYRLVEFVSNLPLRLKIHGRKQKVILKKCLAHRLPDFVVRRPKHGFAVPLASWWRKDLKGSFEERVFDGRWYAALNRREVDRIWTDHQSGRIDHGLKLWSLFVFCSWYNRQGTLA